MICPDLMMIFVPVYKEGKVLFGGQVRGLFTGGYHGAHGTLVMFDCYKQVALNKPKKAKVFEY